MPHALTCSGMLLSALIRSPSRPRRSAVHSEHRCEARNSLTAFQSQIWGAFRCPAPTFAVDFHIQAVDPLLHRDARGAGRSLRGLHMRACAGAHCIEKRKRKITAPIKAHSRNMHATHVRKLHFMRGRIRRISPAAQALFPAAESTVPSFEKMPRGYPGLTVSNASHCLHTFLRRARPSWLV